ncbi:hypothetical protein [Fulvimarina sp. MAC3]|uniref:hypothetical protein n=1 Tax=Fulvimarina sp. MAC3 TaxID=3148887 RepID=UPI0031FBBF2E
MLEIVERKARKLAEKAEELDNRDIAHAVRDLHASIVSVARIMERRSLTAPEQRTYRAAAE